MKTNILTAILTVFFVIGLNAQITNTAAVNNAIVESNKKVNVVIDTNAPTGKDYNKVDLAISGSGTAINGATDVGLDVSLSIDPIKALPNLWVGISQSLYWQPTLAGSTDIDVDWVFNAYKQLYIEPGWSVGDVYSKTSPSFLRTGPELILQYYWTDNFFTSSGVNYDITKDSENSGFRYTIIEFGWEF